MSAARDESSAWYTVSGGLLPILATLAVCADMLSTAAFLSLGVGTELNGLLVAALERGLFSAVAVALGTQGVLLAGAWLSLGSVSTYLAMYLVVTMGVGGGLNNTVLVLTGQPLLALPDPVLQYLAAPTLATVVGLATVWWRHDDQNWVAVGLVAGALLGGELFSVLV